MIKLKNNYKYNKISNNEILKRKGLFWLKVLETSSPQSVGPVTIGLRVTHQMSVYVGAKPISTRQRRRGERRASHHLPKLLPATSR